MVTSELYSIQKNAAISSNPTKNLDYVTDSTGKFLLTRGPLPSSIPTRSHIHVSHLKFDELERRYTGLKNELDLINNQIENKRTEMALKSKNAALGTQNISSKSSLSSLAGASIHGLGFQWKTAAPQPTVLSSTNSPHNNHNNDRRAKGQWGDLTKTCDNTQNHLYLRSAAFVPKNKKRPAASTASPIIWPWVTKCSKNCYLLVEMAFFIYQWFEVRQ